MKANPTRALLMALAAVSAIPAVLAQEIPTPSSLTETYQDWRVACTRQDNTRQCAMSQQLRRPDGQRILTIEVTPAKDGSVTGRLLLPFGLALEKGVTLGPDDAAPGPAMAFKTCLPAGCIVPVAFAPAAVKAYRSGTVIKLNMSASDTGRAISFAVSLKGFGAAFDRTSALLR